MPAAVHAEFDEVSDILDVEDSSVELNTLDVGLPATDDIIHEEVAAAGDYGTPSFDAATPYGDSGRYDQQPAYGDAPSYGAQYYGSGPPPAPQAYGDSGPYSQQQYGSGPYAQPQYASDAHAQPQPYGGAYLPIGDSTDQLYGNADAGNDYIAPEQQYQLADQRYQPDELLHDDPSDPEGESEATMIGASLQPGSSYRAAAPQSYRSSYPPTNDGVPSEPVYDSLGAAQEYAEDMESDGYGYDYGSAQPPPLEPPPDEDFLLPFDNREKDRK